ncbi:hypothetical protein MHBO_004191 [Bonamia ostreae]|uniref:Uncharacterized protein n=1 Tax=Bonamia ostreae TaxID=126728 RepID=A0ABV2ASM3_9EUKA
MPKMLLEFENGVIKWKFSGGIKIGSAFVFNKKFKPRVFFDKEQMVLSYFNNEEGKIFDQIIPYSAVAACTVFNILLSFGNLL